MNFLDLPVDILFDILSRVYDLDKEQGNEGEPHSLIHRTVSRVCRQLRSLIVMTPLFWSVISSNWSPRKLREFIRYSGNMPLTINIVCDYTTTRPAHMAYFVKNVVTELAPRCKTMTISAIDDGLGTEYSILHTISDACPTLHLPVLEHLELYASSGDSRFVDMWSPINRYSIGAINGWSMPSLRHLKTSKWIPRLPNSGALESMEIRAISRGDDYRPSFDELVGLLCRAPTLRTLNLALDDDSFNESSALAMAWRDNPVVLNQLTDLTLDLRPYAYLCSDIPKPLFQLVQSLRCPDLDRLTLTMNCSRKTTVGIDSFGYEEVFRSLIATLLTGLHPTSLREIVLRLDTQPYFLGQPRFNSEIITPVSIILQQSPQIQTIRVESYHARVDNSNESRIIFNTEPDITHPRVFLYPPTTLHLSGLPIDQDSFVKSMLKRLSQGPEHARISCIVVK